MRVVELTAFHVRIPLRKQIRHASHTRDANDTLIVRCRLDNGIEGWGEGLPRPYVTGESIDTAFGQLDATNLKRQLGEPFDDLRSAIALSEKLQLEKPAVDKRDCFGNAARCALELSLLDATARSVETPLSAVTALVPETLPIRCSADRVRYSAVMTSTSPLKQSVGAWMFRLYGFHQCKVKVGVEGTDDAANMKRIRRALGTSIDVRIDVNEAWSCENLEAKLEPLLPFDVSALEQPVPHEQVDMLAAVRENIAVPLVLDESLCSFSDAHRAIELRTCDMFNIRLSKCGGFINSLKLAALAHRAGLGYQLGCQVGETGILSAAGRHFATSVAQIRYLEGSYDRFLVRGRSGRLLVERYVVP